MKFEFMFIIVPGKVIVFVNSVHCARLVMWWLNDQAESFIWQIKCEAIAEHFRPNDESHVI